MSVVTQVILVSMLVYYVRFWSDSLSMGCAFFNRLGLSAMLASGIGFDHSFRALRHSAFGIRRMFPAPVSAFVPPGGRTGVGQDQRKVPGSSPSSRAGVDNRWPGIAVRPLAFVPSRLSFVGHAVLGSCVLQGISGPEARGECVGFSICWCAR